MNGSDRMLTRSPSSPVPSQKCIIPRSDHLLFFLPAFPDQAVVSDMDDKEAGEDWEDRENWEDREDREDWENREDLVDWEDWEIPAYPATEVTGIAR